MRNHTIRRGEDHPRYKPKDVALISSLRDAGKTYEEIGAQVGLTGPCIRYVLKSKVEEEKQVQLIIQHSHGLVPFMAKDIKRFWSKVTKTDSCWIFTGLSSEGYGQLTKKHDGHQYHFGSHRISWIIKNGPVPDGLFVCHNCPGGDNRACVNPDHLFLGTNQENQDDMRRKGRGQKPKGELNVRAKLKDADILNIRSKYSAGGVTCRDIAERYNVAASTIALIVRRDAWAHIA